MSSMKAKLMGVYRKIFDYRGHASNCFCGLGPQVQPLTSWNSVSIQLRPVLILV